MGLDWLIDPKAPSGFDPPIVEVWSEEFLGCSYALEELGDGQSLVFCYTEAGVIEAWRKAQAFRYWAIHLNGKLVKAVHLRGLCHCIRCELTWHGVGKCLC